MASPFHQFTSLHILTHWGFLNTKHQLSAENQGTKWVKLKLLILSKTRVCIELVQEYKVGYRTVGVETRPFYKGRELSILQFNLKSLRHDSWNNAMRLSFSSADFLSSSPSIQTYVSNKPWCLRRPASFSLIGQWFILLLVRCISLTSRADVFSPLTAKLALPYPNLNNIESKQALSYRCVIRIGRLLFARIISVALISI